MCLHQVALNTGISCDKRLHFGERYVTSFTISATLQVVKVKLTVACNKGKRCGQNFLKEIA